MRLNKNKIRTLALCTVVLLIGSLSFQILSTVSIPAVNAAFSPSNPASFGYVVNVWMENQNYGSVIGSSSAPYETQLASTYSTDTSYHNLGASCGCSLPEYMGFFAGQYPSCANNDGSPSGCNDSSQNLVDRFETAGVTWQAYAENYPVASGCYTQSNPGNGGFYDRHFMFNYYSDIVNSPSRCAKLFNSGGSAGSSSDSAFLATLNQNSGWPNFIWLSPNGCNQTHDCGISTGDSYLSGLVPQILNSNLFKTGKAALVITWDDNGSPPNIQAGPVVKQHYVSTVTYDHYSWLKTIEWNWGLPTITSNDASASPMTDIFTSGPPPPPTPDFSLTANATSLFFQPGGSGSVTMTAAFLNGLTTVVGLTATAPSGITVSCSPATLTTVTLTSSCTFSGTGSGTANITGTTGILTHTVSIAVSAASQPTGTFVPSQWTLLGSGGTINSNGVFHIDYNNPSGSWGFTGVACAGCPFESQMPAGSSQFINKQYLHLSGKVISATSLGQAMYVETSLYYQFDQTGLSLPLLDGMSQSTHWENGAYQPVGNYVGSGSDSVHGTYQAWREITAVTQPGQTFDYTVDMYALFNRGVAGLGLPAGTTGHLVRIEPGIEGYGVVSVDYYTADMSGTWPTPQLSTSFRNTPTAPQANQAISFSASATGGTAPYTYSWTFGDGSTSTGQIVTHAYSKSGPFSVTLTTKDSASPQNSANSTNTIAVALPPPPDFGISLTPTSLSVVQGQSGAATVTVNSRNSLTGSISLSATVAPLGPTESFNASSLILVAGGSATSTLTVSTTRSTPISSFTVVITATNGTVSHSVTLLLSVAPIPVPDFGLSANPTNLSTILQGASGSSTITISSVNGLGGSISLSTSNIPSGTTATFSPSSVVLSAGSTGISTLTVTTTNNTPAGSYGLAVTATNGTISHSLTLTFSVAIPPPPDFAIASDQSSLSIVVGSSRTATITLSSLAGFAGTVSLTSSISTSSATSSLNPTTVSISSGGTGSSLLTVSTTTSSTTGTFNILLTGTSGSFSHSLTISVTITPLPDFDLVASPSAITIPAGSSGYVTLTMTSLNGFSDTLVLSTSITGVGFSPSMTPSSVNILTGGQSTSALTISTTSAVSAGSYSVTLTATGTGLSHQVTILVTVTAPSNQPLRGSLTLSQTKAQVGQEVPFSGSAANGAQPYLFLYNFGDGSAATGASSSHSYTAPGNYTVTLIVIDASNITVAVQKILNVVSNLPLITGPGSETTSTGSLLTFTITASNPGTPGAISLSATNLPRGATFTSTRGNPATGTLTWTPDQSARSGSYNVNFKAVQDGTNYTNSRDVTINLAAASATSSSCFFICGLSPVIWMTIILAAAGGSVGLLTMSGAMGVFAPHRRKIGKPALASVLAERLGSMPGRVSVTPVYGAKRAPYGSRSLRVPDVHKPAFRKVSNGRIVSRAVQSRAGNGRRRRNSR